MRHAGIDWAGNGWIAVMLDEEEWDAGFYPTVLNFWHEYPRIDRTLIDVPVGLSKDDVRAPDEAAIDYLESSSTVFRTPVRDAVYADDIETAKGIHDERGVGTSISTQAWALVPRIREVDAFVQEFTARLEKVEFLESHPEVCFAALNGGDPVDAKKTSEAGRERRLQLLEGHLENPTEVFESIVDRFGTPDYAPLLRSGATDDVVDAMGLAVAAAHDDLVDMPADPARDFKLGREIKMVRPPEAD